MSGYLYSRENSTRYALVFILFLIGVLLTVALYFVKTKAQSAQTQAQRLGYQIDQEQDAIDVLRAEIAHLESPARLQALSIEELGLEPLAVNQFLSVSDIDADIAMRDKTLEDKSGDQ